MTQMGTTDDAQVFATLYPGLRRFAAAVSNLGTDPDDLVQEAVVNALRRGPLAELDDPAAYLRRAIVNRVRNDHRNDGRRTRILASAPPPSAHVDTYPSDFVDLSNLTVDQRAVLFLKYVEHRDTDDIATLLDLSADAVRARSSRAIRALRLELDRTETPS